VHAAQKGRARWPVQKWRASPWNCHRSQICVLHRPVRAPPLLPGEQDTVRCRMCAYTEVVVNLIVSRAVIVVEAATVCRVIRDDEVGTRVVRLWDRLPGPLSIALAPPGHNAPTPCWGCAGYHTSDAAELRVGRSHGASDDCGCGRRSCRLPVCARACSAAGGKGGGGGEAWRRQRGWSALLKPGLGAHACGEGCGGSLVRRTEGEPVRIVVKYGSRSPARGPRLPVAKRSPCGPTGAECMRHGWACGVAVHELNAPWSDDSRHVLKRRLDWMTEPPPARAIKRPG
jgi:hypothetical protein